MPTLQPLDGRPPLSKARWVDSLACSRWSSLRWLASSYGWWACLEHCVRARCETGRKEHVGVGEEGRSRDVLDGGSGWLSSSASTGWRALNAKRPRHSFTYQPSARGQLGEQRASLSAAISQASTAPRRTPLCEPLSLDPLRGSVRMTWQARAPGGGPTALRGTTPTGPLVSQTHMRALTRIVASCMAQFRTVPGTIVLVREALAPCAGCHPRRPRPHHHHRRPRRRRPRRHRIRRGPRR